MYVSAFKRTNFENWYTRNAKPCFIVPIEQQQQKHTAPTEVNNRKKYIQSCAQQLQQQHRSGNCRNSIKYHIHRTLVHFDFELKL